MLGLIAQGTSTFFDSKTHRQVRQVFTRLHYVYVAGEILRNGDDQALEEHVLEHLQKAQQAQRRALGESERSGWEKMPRQFRLRNSGHASQTQIYRQVLLGAITELWVDYLTRVESLRVSVGLEAYAQSDPLVKYKSQASDMFQGLLGDIRVARDRENLPVSTTLNDGATEDRHPEPVEAPGPAVELPVLPRQTRHKVPVKKGKGTGTNPVENLKDFYYALPKVELHRHLEGSLRLRTMLEIARTQGITVPASTGPLSSLVQVQKSEPSTYQNFLAKFSTLRLFYRSPEVIARVNAKRWKMPQKTISVTWNCASHRRP